MPHFRPQALAGAKVWCNSLDVINHANCDSTKYNEICKIKELQTTKEHFWMVVLQTTKEHLAR